MKIELPPLPEPEHPFDSDDCTYACPEGFSADQMRSYAAAALAAARQAERERCAAVGRCEKDASQRPAAVRHCPTCDQARSRGCWDPGCKWPCGPNSDSTSAPKEQA